MQFRNHATFDDGVLETRGSVLRAGAESIRSMNVYVIDTDHRRRAEISRALSRPNFHIEPLELPSELPGRWSLSGGLLVADEQDLIAATISWRSKHGCRLPLIAYSQRGVTRRIVGAIRLGATDYLEWPSDQAEFVATIASHIRDHLAIGRTAPERKLPMSRREREVLACFSRGMPANDIALELGIQARTVAAYRLNIVRKLGAHGFKEAVRDGCVPACIEDGINPAAPESRSFCAKNGAVGSCVTISGAASVNETDEGTAVKLQKLSNREQEILHLMFEGMSSKQIGCRLGISHRTVEIHRANISVKLSARNASHAIRIALANNYIRLI